MDTLNDLREAGHSQSDIYDMTIDQMQLHLKSHTKKKLMDQINRMSLDAVASQGDSKAITKSIKNLQKVIEEIEKS